MHLPVSIPNKKEALVSIVVPIFNTEEFLPYAIRSVLSQSYKNWELLLLNDGSEGNAREVMEHFYDPRIKYFEHSNKGPAATRNRGMRESLGSYIAFLDSDDVWNYDKLAKQMALFNKDPRVGVVYSQRETVNRYAEVISGYQPKLYKGMVLNRLWVDNFVCMSSAIIHRRVVETIGYFDENLRMSEDFDYWLRVAYKFPFAYINEPLVKYRKHEGQVSLKTDMRFATCIRIRERFDLQHNDSLSFTARRISKANQIAEIAHYNKSKLSTLGALKGHLRALLWYPFLGLAWNEIAHIFIPRPLINVLRIFKRCIIRIC